MKERKNERNNKRKEIIIIFCEQPVLIEIGETKKEYIQYLEY